MGAKNDRSPIEMAAREFIRALRDRVERPAQQCILALERITKLDVNDPEIEMRCARGLREAAAGIRSINLNGIINQTYELERGLRRIADAGPK
jgi:hypothetical protein